MLMAIIKKTNTVVKNVGIYFDQYMLFDSYIDEMSRKVNGILLYLNRIGDSFKRSTRTMVVQSLVLSIVSYCSRVWGTTNKTQIERVQKLQNFLLILNTEQSTPGLAF